MYAASRRNLEDLEAKAAELDNETLNLMADMKLSHAILEESDPEYLRRYNMEQKMFKSFSYEQQDFICAQIGWWYLMMKPLLEGTHNLGHMKEVLKGMICGE
jgi:hypothetical protein